MQRDRIQHLDALRGLAIILVVFFHAYSRWSVIMPYGDRYADWPVIKQGWLGVELFFLISGYVILMTLERIGNLNSFLFKRWLRLFPAMAIGTVIIFVTGPLLVHRPNGLPTWLSLLPGLTFIDSYWWSKLLGVTVAPVENAFWSLFVEFKFYVISATVYFSKLRRFYLAILVGLFLFSQMPGMMAQWAPDHLVLNIRRVSGLFSLEHFGWFAAGAAFYKAGPAHRGFWWSVGVAISAICSWQVSQGRIDVALFAGLLSSVFAVSFRCNLFQTLVVNRLFLWLGFVSYPLYLIHENALVSMTVSLGEAYSPIPGWLLPLPPLLMLLAFSHGIARFAEPALRQYLQKVIDRMKLEALPRPV